MCERRISALGALFFAGAKSKPNGRNISHDINCLISALPQR
jgi:hypothetical protein